MMPQTNANDDSTSSAGFGYSSAQTYVLEYIVYLSAPLSILGSTLIIYVIFAERQKLATSAYHRIMLGMSILDWMTSMSVVVLGPWVVPDEIDFVHHGHGSFRTCAVAGFFLVSICIFIRMYTLGPQ